MVRASLKDKVLNMKFFNMSNTKVKLLCLSGILASGFFLIFFCTENVLDAGEPGGPMIRLMICLKLPQTSYFLYQPSADAVCRQNDIIWSIPGHYFDSCIGKKVKIEIYHEDQACTWSREIVISGPPSAASEYTFRVLKFLPRRNMYYPQSSPWRNRMWSDVEILRVRFIDRTAADEADNCIYFTPSDKFLVKVITDCTNVSLSTQSYGSRKEIIADMQSWGFFGKNPLTDYSDQLRKCSFHMSENEKIDFHM